MKRYLNALLLSLLSAPSWALIPENGFWWNPADTGSRRGYSIEIQDNVLFFAGYLYQSNGAATWFTSAGTLTVDNSLDTARYDGVLDGSFGGPCITCANRPATAQPGIGGNLRLEFFSETRGRLTWAGGSIPIERFDYALTPAGGAARTDAMLGQWQFMIDFSPITNEYPFYGDAIILNSRTTDGSEQFVNGCRVSNSEARSCSSSNLSSNGASAFHFIETVSGISKDRVVIAVRDNSSRFLVYALDYGTYQMNGLAKQCSSSIPANQRYSQCIRNSAVTALPVRGIRSMSRAYMSGNNAAPKQAQRVNTQSAPTMPDFGPDFGSQPDPEAEQLWESIPQAAFEALMRDLDSKP